MKMTAERVALEKRRRSLLNRHQDGAPKTRNNAAVTYTLTEVARMLDVSTATVRRLIQRRHLIRAEGAGSLRITRFSIEKLLRPAATGPVDIASQLNAYGPCLVVRPEEIVEIYRYHEQTVYRKLAEGRWRTIPWLWNRRVLKSEIAAALGEPEIVHFMPDVATQNATRLDAGQGVDVPNQFRCYWAAAA